MRNKLRSALTGPGIMTSVGAVIAIGSNVLPQFLTDEVILSGAGAW